VQAAGVQAEVPARGHDEHGLFVRARRRLGWSPAFG